MKPALILMMVLASVAPAASEEDAELEFHGRRLAETNCSGCHAITLHDDSDHPDAPAFRDLPQRYPIDALEEAFAEGIYVGHPDMPEFAATPEQIDAILAYIESIR